MITVTPDKFNYSMQQVKKIFQPLLAEFDRSKPWIAGGAIRDVILFGKPMGDIDLYSVTGRWEEMAYQKPSFEGKNDTRYETKWGTLDCIKIVFPTPEATILDYDFTVCCAAYDGKNFYHHEKYFEHLLNRQLYLSNVQRPLEILDRLQKYNRKGFTMPVSELAILAEAIRKTKAAPVKAAGSY